MTILQSSIASNVIQGSTGPIGSTGATGPLGSTGATGVQGLYDTDNKCSKSGQNYLTVQYDKIVPLLIQSIKEQQQIEELRRLINGN